MGSWEDLTPEEIARRLAALNGEAEINPYGLEAKRDAAVLVPLLRAEGEWRLLFIHRAANQHDPHSGQVSFPGGSYEEGDHDYIATACREAEEEIGVPAEAVQVLGTLPRHCTVTGYCIAPVVGKIPWPYPLRLSKEEVVRAFTVPLRWLAAIENRTLREYEIPRYGRVRSWFYRPYDGEVIWGATARMVDTLVRALRNEAVNSAVNSQGD